MTLLTIALTASLLTPDETACADLDRAYEEVELLQLDGEDATNELPELLDSSARCSQIEQGRRKALEGYFLAFSVAQVNDELPSFACEPLKESLLLAESLTAELPKNTRIRMIHDRLTLFSEKVTCEVEESDPESRGFLPVAQAVPGDEENPAPKSKENTTEAKSKPEVKTKPEAKSKSNERISRSTDKPVKKIQKVDSNERTEHGRAHLRLKHGAIASGILSGVALATAGTLTGLTQAEAYRVYEELDNDQPEGLDTQTVCKLGSPYSVADTYCETLNNLNIGTIVAWSVVGAASITTGVLTVLYLKRRRKSRAVSIVPQFSIGRSHATLGFSTRF